jgi:hypothetical protein
LAIALACVVLAGCASKPTDYRAVWSSSSSTPTTTQAASSMMPYLQYLQEKGVDGAPMTQQTLTDLSVSIPQPGGWAVVTDPDQPTAFEILRKTAVSAFQPVAVLFVYKLTGGDFDVNEALKRGYGMPGAKVGQFKGMPSSVIEATYPDASGQKIHRYNQIVFATAKPPGNQRYLVQFSITTGAAPEQEQDPDVLTIIKGFTVAVR